MLSVVITSGTTAVGSLASGGQIRLVTYNNSIVAMLKAIDCNGQLNIAGSTLTSATQHGKIDTLFGADFSVNGISLTNTDVLSTFSIDVGRSFTLPVNGMTTDGSIKTVRLGGTTFSGAFNTAGARNLTFGDLTGGALNVGSGLGATAFRAGTITNSTFNFDSPISQFQTGPIVSTTPGGTSLFAPYVTNFKINGDANLNLTLGTGVRYSLGKADIGGSVWGTWTTGGPITSLRANSFNSDWTGNIGGRLNFLSSKGDFAGFLSTPIGGNVQLGSATNATFRFTQPFAARTWNVSNFSVDGTFSGSSLTSDGNLGFLRFGSVLDSTIFSGVDPIAPINVLPTPSQLASMTTIKGEYVRQNFQNGFTAGGSFVKLDLGTVIPQATGAPFGVTTNAIGSLEFEVNNKRVSAFHVDRLLDIQTAEQRKGVTSQDLGNFQISMARAF